MTISELLAEDKFWDSNSEVYSDVRSPLSEAPPEAQPIASLAKRYFPRFSGVAFAAALVIQCAAVQPRIRYHVERQHLDLSSAREVALAVEEVERLEASDLTRAPDLERGSRILARLKKITAFDDYV